MKITLRYQFLGLIIIIGLLLYFVISELLFINRTPLVKAQITRSDYYDVTDSDSTDWYSLDLYIISAGKTIINFPFKTGFTNPEFKAGQIVELYYDKEDPYNSEIKNIFVQWGTPMILVFILCIDLIIMCGLYFVFNRKENIISKNDIIISE